MPIIPNPQTQKWRAGLPGKFAGDIYQSWNIDLEKSPGKVSLPQRPIIITDSVDVSGMGVPKHFLRTDADTTDRWWCLNTGKMAKTSGSSVNVFSADAIANTPTDAQDMVVHETASGYQRLVVTRASDIGLLSNGTWTASWWVATLAQSALSSSYFHPIERLDRLVAVGDGEFIHTIDQSDIVAYKRLSFNSSYKCIAIYVSLTRFWFVFQNKFGGKGIIAEWDGGAEKANVIYEINGNPIFGFIKDDTLRVTTDNGVIWKFNGRGFSPDNQFPFFEENQVFASGSITHRNTTIDGDVVYMNVTQPANSIRMRGGIWALNTITNNLYHIYGLGQSKYSDNSTQWKDIGQSKISYAGAIVNLFSNTAAQSGKFLVGATIYTIYSGTSINAIYSFYNWTQRGYFITSLIPSSEVEHYWYNLWLRYSGFYNNNVSIANSIVTKYRVTEGLIQNSGGLPTLAPKEATITWTGGTTFTGAIPTGVAVGHEVEILAGDNAGCCAHISTLSATPDGSSTITVTIDEALLNTSSRASYARFDDWVKITSNNPITSSTANATRDTNQVLKDPTLASGPYVQFKVEMRGVLVEIDQLRVDAKFQQGTPL